MKQIIIGILVVGCMVGAIALGSGYIPTPNNLEMVEPVGNIQTDIEEDKIAQFEEVLANEDLKDIQYQIYKTDKSVDEVYEGYKSDLESQGYYEEQSGYEIVKGHYVFYYAFVKGLIGTVFAISTVDDETYILYSTGSVLDYMEIKNELETKI